MHFLAFHLWRAAQEDGKGVKKLLQNKTTKLPEDHSEQPHSLSQKYTHTAMFVCIYESTRCFFTSFFVSSASAKGFVRFDAAAVFAVVLAPRSFRKQQAQQERNLDFRGMKQERGGGVEVETEEEEDKE